jgi:hypothetical protein
MAPDTVRGTATGISDSGHVSGALSPFVPCSSCQAFVWRAGQLTTVRVPLIAAAVSGVNDAGDFATVYLSGYEWSSLWLGGTREQALGGLSGRYIHVESLNDSSDAVGFGEFMPFSSQAVLWSRASGYKATTLGPVANPPLAYQAHDINNARQIVGEGSAGGFVWQDGRLSVLTLLLADTSWTVTNARAINARGQILADAKRSGAPFTTPVLLTPRP